MSGFFYFLSYSRIKYYSSLLLITTIALFIADNANAQEDSLPHLLAKQRSYTLNLHYGSIYAHSIDIKNTAGARPRGFSFEIANRAVDTATWNRYGCYPTSGIMFSYVDLNTPILGSSYTAAYIFEPTFRLNSRMDLFIKIMRNFTRKKYYFLWLFISDERFSEKNCHQLL